MLCDPGVNAADAGINSSGIHGLPDGPWPAQPTKDEQPSAAAGNSSALELVPCSRCAQQTIKIGVSLQLQFCQKDVNREKTWHLQAAKAGKEEALLKLKKSDPKKYLELFNLFCNGLPVFSYADYW